MSDQPLLVSWINPLQFRWPLAPVRVKPVKPAILTPGHSSASQGGNRYILVSEVYSKRPRNPKTISQHNFVKNHEKTLIVRRERNIYDSLYLSSFIINHIRIHSSVNSNSTWTPQETQIYPPIHHHPPSTRHLTDIYINRRIRLKEKQNSQIPPFCDSNTRNKPPLFSMFTRENFWRSTC